MLRAKLCARNELGPSFSRQFPQIPLFSVFGFFDDLDWLVASWLQRIFECEYFSEGET
jgi:hypothetical protein